MTDSDCENSMADKRAPGSERAAERRLGPHMQVYIHTYTHTLYLYTSVHNLNIFTRNLCLNDFQAFDYEKKKLLATKGKQRLVLLI